MSPLFIIQTLGCLLVLKDFTLIEFITGTVSLTSGDTNELGQAGDCEIVLAFDMSRDVFGVIRLPDEVFRKLRFPVGVASCMNKDFAMFNDCLAFIVYKL